MLGWRGTVAGVVAAAAVVVVVAAKVVVAAAVGVVVVVVVVGAPAVVGMVSHRKPSVVPEHVPVRWEPGGHCGLEQARHFPSNVLRYWGGVWVHFVVQRPSSRMASCVPYRVAPFSTVALVGNSPTHLDVRPFIV